MESSCISMFLPGAWCSPVESSLWRGVQKGTGFLEGATNHSRPTLEKSVPEGLHPTQRIHAGTVIDELQPVGSHPCWSCG